MANYYNLIGGITTQQIINSVPMFDAMSEDFWILANEYIPKDILCDTNYNKQFVEALKTNIWFRNAKSIEDCMNNGLSISYNIENDILQSLSIANQSNKLLFGIRYENI